MAEKMDLTWVKPAIWSAAVSIVLTVVVGFTLGGWYTGGGAETMARLEARAAVTQALTPVCLAQARADPDFATKVEGVKAASSYQQDDLVLDAGWATVPGGDKNRDVAKACADILAKESDA